MLEYRSHDFRAFSTRDHRRDLLRLLLVQAEHFLILLHLLDFFIFILRVELEVREILLNFLSVKDLFGAS